VKKILLTGSEGDVGKVLLPRLAKRFDIVGFDLRPHHGPLNVIQGDLTRYEEVAAAVEGMDAVIHVAALLDCREVAKAVDMNVKATANVMQAAMDKGVRRVVYCSTVWASGHGFTEPYMPIDEETPCAPVCVYGQTKWLGELMTEWYARQYGLETVILRFCGFYPAAGYDEEGGIDWDNADAPGLFLRYFGAGFKLMNPADLGEAFTLATEKPGIAGERFVIGCSTPYAAVDAAGLRSLPLAVAERYYPGVTELFAELGIRPEPVRYYFSHEKARTRLGFRSQHDLGDLMRLYREWKGQ